MTYEKRNPARGEAAGRGTTNDMHRNAARNARAAQAKRRTPDPHCRTLCDDAGSASDRRFFAENPGRNYRLRPARQGEVRDFLRFGKSIPERYFLCVAIWQVWPGVRLRVFATGIPTATVNHKSSSPAAGLDLKILSVAVMDGQEPPKSRRGCRSANAITAPCGRGGTGRRAGLKIQFW